MMEPLRHGDRVALLTSGGDAPGMNAALRAAARWAPPGLELLGVGEGYKGLMEGRVRAQHAGARRSRRRAVRCWAARAASAS